MAKFITPNVFSSGLSEKLISAQLSSASKDYTPSCKEFLTILLNHCLQRGCELEVYRTDIFIESIDQLDLIVSKFQELGFRKLSHSKYESYHERYNMYDTVLIKNESVILLSANMTEYQNSYELKVDFFGVNQTSTQELLQKIKDVINVWPRKEPIPQSADTISYIYMLYRSPDGKMQTANFPFETTDFIAENYDEDVVSRYQYICEQIKNPKPSGRLTILQGAPGTGKTHFIRSLVRQCNDVMFIMVPANLSEKCSSTDVLLLLRRLHDNAKVIGNTISARNGPPLTEQEKIKSIVFVFEDADSLIGKRTLHTESLVSSLLNLTDGLYSAITDIKVLATTNLEMEDFDPAITRPGRLSSMVKFELLNYDKSNKIYHRLIGNADSNLDNTKQHWSLAEIYNESAKTTSNIVINSNTSVRKKIGF